LSYSPRDKRIVNQWAAVHTTTLAGGRPLLVLDIYEHAYHTDYGAAAARYVDVFMEAIRWDTASKLFEQYSRESCGEPLASGDCRRHADSGMWPLHDVRVYFDFPI